MYNGQNRHCIVCGAEFEPQRYGRMFCDSAACRQKHNREERRIKKAADDITALVQQLMTATKSEHFSRLAEQLLRDSEKTLASQLDKIAPDRNKRPPAVFDARRVAEIHTGGKYWALPPDAADLLPVKIVDTQGSWYECEVLTDKNTFSRYHTPRFLLPSSTVLIEITERGQDAPAPVPAPAPALEEDNDYSEEEDYE